MIFCFELSHFLSESSALYEMGKAFELMANPQSAQLQFMEALQLIENSSAQEKARMENYYRLGEFTVVRTLSSSFYCTCI